MIPMKARYGLVGVVTALILFAPISSFAAVTDFTANSNITVSSVTFGVTTADMLILNTSTAESWVYSAGTFTITNPGTFKVGSSDSSVKSIQITQSGTIVGCSENATPGTSSVTLPTTAGTYTVVPSATTACTSLCTALTNVASYNAFPTCGALTCNVGYAVSGSGSSATCVSITAGGISGAHRQAVAPIQKTNASPTAVASVSVAVSTGQSKLSTNLKVGTRSSEVHKLQQLLSTDSEIYPKGEATGYYGQETKKAVGRFQIKYKILNSPSSPGYGSVGPKTRAKLNEVFN